MVPGEFPVVVDKTAVEPLFLPVVIKTRPQVDCDPDLTLSVDEEKDSQVEDGPDVLSGRVMDMGDPDVGRNIQVLMDVGPMMIDGSDTDPLSLPVVANTEKQVDVRWEATLEVVPFVVGDVCPMGWLETEYDGCVMEEVVLVPEMSPIISMKSVVVPTFLPALSEVCSLTILAGGSLLQQPPWQW